MYWFLCDECFLYFFFTVILENTIRGRKTVWSEPMRCQSSMKFDRLSTLRHRVPKKYVFINNNYVDLNFVGLFIFITISLKLFLYLPTKFFLIWNYQIELLMNWTSLKIVFRMTLSYFNSSWPLSLVKDSVVIILSNPTPLATVLLFFYIFILTIPTCKEFE